MLRTLDTAEWGILWVLLSRDATLHSPVPVVLAFLVFLTRPLLTARLYSA